MTINETLGTWSALFMLLAAMTYLVAFVAAFAGLLMSMFISRRRVWVRATTDLDDQGRPATVVEYGLLARGEDPRLRTEAESLGELFTTHWKAIGVRDDAGDRTESAPEKTTDRARRGPTTN